MTAPQINLQYTTIKDPLPDFIYEGLKEYSSGANLYRPQPDILVEKLAKKHHVPKERIYLTAGIDEAIQMFAHAYGQHAYVFTPTYVVYKDVEEFGGKLTRIFSISNKQYVINPTARPDATLIYLANPNNPSGITPKEKVLELVRNNKHAIVAIDEAYGAFANLSVIDEVVNYPNMAVFRSFSKGYGMAGNRIGYMIANPSIIKVVMNKTQWSNVSYLSVGAAVTALDHEEYFEKMRLDINARRDVLTEFLSKHKYAIIPSQINAVLLKFPNEKDATGFVEYLKKHNVTVSHGNGTSNIGLDHSFVRISIGNAKQMQSVREVIKRFS
ncbi:aminotransferase class I/II-fold pyridoxal phosphate-dependent enzyme [Candidatus Gottesmanbacteria bacterium]|nr:aminotransferase class I/II-fold pyridoxal phosphate-dependent enzyme [Candidatus Gottesmanbacteria bacterium]